MKKEKSIQADIWFIKGILQNEYQENDNSPLTPRGLQEKQSLERIISALEAMREAEMPEKKDIDNYNAEEIGGKSWQRAIAFNEAISLCQPIVSKLLEDNKELRKKIKELENA